MTESDRSFARTLTDCPDCLDAVSFPLIAACASVGIEHGRSTHFMLALWLGAFHERGHTS